MLGVAPCAGPKVTHPRRGAIGSGYIISNTGILKSAGMAFWATTGPSPAPWLALTPVTSTAYAICANASLPGLLDYFSPYTPPNTCRLPALLT